MIDHDPEAKPFTLKRWSQRKLEVARTAAKHAPAVASPAEPVAVPPAAGADEADAPPRTTDAELPPVETLTIDSDFRPFLDRKVDESLKRKALKQLFRDPHFNVMDGLDVYIDDYSQPDPIAPEIVRQLAQARYIFDPPQTRVTEQGHVEDVPPEAQVAEPSKDDEPAAPADVPESETAKRPDPDDLST